MSSSENLFFEGDLHAGISLAIEEDKPVVCFVAGNNEESLQWEEDYFSSSEIVTSLAAKAITLRIRENSLEASYLAAYYPISVAPTLILTQVWLFLNNTSSQGQLLLELKSGTSKIRFQEEILNAIGTRSNVLPSSSVSQRSVPATMSLAPSVLSSSSNNTEFPAFTQSNLDETANSSGESSSNLSQASSRVQTLLDDRRRRLEADKKAKDEAEKAIWKAKVEAQQEAMRNSPDPSKAKQVSYAEQQRRRQLDERLERERIMKDIQNDKATRREKEERRKALAGKVEANDGANGLVNGQILREISSTSSKPRDDCALQVRLFDGSTIRKRFPLHETLQSVRAWISDQGSDGDSPYTLKQILSPLPNRTIHLSEEEESLRSLGFVPSATLVKVPVQGYTTAYEVNQGIIFRGVSAAYGAASAGINVLAGVLGAFLSFGQAARQAEETTPQGQGEAIGSESGIRIRTLRDQREGQEKHQLYNGNQLNFEPRPNEDEG